MNRRLTYVRETSMRDKGVPGGVRKQRAKDGGRLAPAEVPDGRPLTLAELRRAATVAATVPVPDGVFATDRPRCLYAVSTRTPQFEVSRVAGDSNLWCVDATEGTVLSPHAPGRHLEAQRPTR